MVSYLKCNPEVIELVRKGDASLIGVSREQESAIISSFSKEYTSSYFWM
ncbi:competence pheromone ComX [Paenibacillus sp. NPDC056722]